jgi:CheY-like chemotaxis protein
MTDREFRSLNVMAIEDEAFSQKVVSELLGNIGVHSVTVAENGADALAKLETGDPAIDLIICDIEMPEMDGYEFVRKVRMGAVPDYREVPIIMLTGKDTDKNAQSARIHKISGFLVKPAKEATMKAAISHALGD